jgi:PAS domain S-box-containing protein
MEEILRESEGKYSSVVENSMDGIIVLQKCIIKFLNQALLDLTGYNLEELIDKEFEPLLSPEYRKFIMNMHQARLAGKDVPSMYEMEIIRKDGLSVPIEVSNTTITYGGEEATLSFIRNITERKQAEEELRESEENLRAILDASPDIIHLLDVNGIILSSNEDSAKRLGLEVDDLLGKSVFDYDAPEETMRSRKAAVDKVFRTGEPLQLEDK